MRAAFDIKDKARRFRILLAILLGVCLLAGSVIASPIGDSRKHRQQEIEALRAELRSKTSEVEPLLGIEEKISDAQAEVSDFYRDRLPSSYAAVSEKLGGIATENGVNLNTGHYVSEPSGLAGLQHLAIDVSVSGDYMHLVRFINAAEREKMFFIVDSVSLSQQQGGTVQLQVRVETLLKAS